jgi:hypothetical protein
MIGNYDIGYFFVTEVDVEWFIRAPSTHYLVSHYRNTSPIKTGLLDYVLLVIIPFYSFLLFLQLELIPKKKKN